MISDVNVYVVDVYVIHEQLSGGLDLAGACLIPWGTGSASMYLQRLGAGGYLSKNHLAP